MDADFFCAHCGAVNPARNVICSFCSHILTPTSYPYINSYKLLKQRYQIREKVGQGGFAAVYKARDLQFSSALRAIKEMDDHLLSSQEKQEAIAAFQQEAHMLACLMHPNLPRIYDHFEEQQHWYLVMDYIDGKTLETILTRSPQGKLPVEKVIQYALQLCTVLNYLHTQVPPIIFRDLKPANIMMTRGEHLYLIDFGIARFFKPGKVKDTVALGSPGYAAPEQFGKAQTTAQADIYGLGATLHHLLSGYDPSDVPFIFLPLKLEPHNNITRALADLVARMVSMEKEKRPASILEVQQTLISLQQANQLGPMQFTVPPRQQTNNSLSGTPPIKPPGYQKWSFRTGGALYSSPTIAHGIIYIGSWDHVLYALDVASGQKIWSFYSGGAVFSSPSVVNGIVYFGSYDHNFYALDAYTGRQKWLFTSGDAIHAPPTITNDVVYFGSWDGNLYALDASTGRKIWSFSTVEKIATSPTVANGIVYFGSYNGYFYALDATSGIQMWAFQTGHKIRSSSTIDNGMVYFGSADHKLYALDAVSGWQKWSFLTGDKITSSPTVINGIIYFGSADGNLYALDATSGRQRWSFLTGDKITSSPTVVNDTVYFGSDDGNLYALDAMSRQKLWYFQTGDRVQSSPAVVNNIAYVGSDDSTLYAIFA